MSAATLREALIDEMRVAHAEGRAYRSVDGEGDPMPWDVDLPPEDPDPDTYSGPKAFAECIANAVVLEMPGSHAILDHSDCTPATIQRGDLITGQGTTTIKAARLGKGSAGQFLKSDGTDVAWAAHGLTYTDVGAAAASHAHAAGDITSGTLSTDRFSAYADLTAESKIGTGSAQVAAGDHNHTGVYDPYGAAAWVIATHESAYNHALLHAAATVADTASVDLSIAGQQISAAVLPAGVDHSALGSLNTTSYTHLTAANHTDLTDAGDSALHYHSADRAWAVITGKPAGTINKILKWTPDTTTPGDSSITDDGTTVKTALALGVGPAMAPTVAGRIQCSEALYVGDKIGVGTIAPLFRLDVADTAEVKMVLKDTNAYVNGTLRTSALHFDALGPGSIYSGDQCMIKCDFTPRTGFAGGKTELSFWTHRDGAPWVNYAEERMRIAHTGRLIVQSSATTYYASTGYDTISVGKRADGDASRISMSYDATHAMFFEVGPAGDLNFYNHATANRLTICNAGNIGLGTTAPMAKTEVYGTGQTVAALTDAGVRGDMLAVNASGTGAGAGGAIVFGNAQSIGGGSIGWAAIKGLLTNGATNTTGDLAFCTRNAVTDTSLTERMRIAAGGHLLVGGTQDDSLVHIQSGSAGTVTARSGTILTVESSDHAYIDILGPSNKIKGLYLGQIDAINAGVTFSLATGLQLNHSDTAFITMFGYQITLEAASGVDWLDCRYDSATPVVFLKDNNRLRFGAAYNNADAEIYSDGDVLRIDSTGHDIVIGSAQHEADIELRAANTGAVSITSGQAMTLTCPNGINLLGKIDISQALSFSVLDTVNTSGTSPIDVTPVCSRIEVPDKGSGLDFAINLLAGSLQQGTIICVCKVGSQAYSVTVHSAGPDVEIHGDRGALFIKDSASGGWIPIGNTI